MHIDRWTGTETRVLREALRLSVRAFAEHLGVAARTVAKWEAGGRSVQLRPDTQAMLDTALSQAHADAQNRFMLMLTACQHSTVGEPDRRSPSTFDGEGAATGRHPQSSIGRFAEIADMDRREVLRLMSLAGALLATPSEDGRPDWERTDNLIGRTARLDTATIDDYAALNKHLWRVFALSASKRELLPMVRSQLDVLTSDLDRPSGPAMRQRLCVLTGDLFQLAGEVFFDGNQYIEASQCYTLAATACREADAFDLWACAMTRHAYVSMYERQFSRAVPMLELAAQLARRGDTELSTRYWVSSVLAQAHAGLGQSVACSRALDQAAKVVTMSGRSQTGGWLRFDGSRLAEERGACYVELGQSNQAETALSDALASSLSLRRRGTVLTDLATVGVQMGDRDRVLTHANAALEVVHQTKSGAVSQKLRRLQTRLAPLRGHRGIEDLSRQLSDLASFAVG